MEPPPGKPRVLEKLLEAVSYDASAKRVPVTPTEHQVRVVPTPPRSTSLSVLPFLVSSKRAEDRPWHSKVTPAAIGLRLDELVLVVDTLQLPVDPDVSEVEVDVAPAQAQGFALAQAHR